MVYFNQLQRLFVFFLKKKKERKKMKAIIKHGMTALWVGLQNRLLEYE